MRCRARATECRGGSLTAQRGRIKMRPYKDRDGGRGGARFPACAGMTKTGAARWGDVVTLSATKGLHLFGVRVNCRFFAALRMTTQSDE